MLRAGLIAVLAIALPCGPAAAQPSEPSAGAAPGAPAEPPGRRAVPDYDGRPDPGPTAGERLLWVPRILLSPLYLLTEYGIRRPLSFLFRLAEGPAAVDPIDFLTFGTGGRIALVPTFYIDFGRQPSAGLYFRWNEAGPDNNRVRAYFATWGPRWLTGRALDRIVGPDERWDFEIRAAATRRPDGLFYGTGTHSTDREATYQLRTLSGGLHFEGEPFRASVVRVHAEVREARFGDDVCCGPSVQSLYDEGQIRELPAGYPDGFLIYEHGAELVLDTRRRRPHNVSGVQLRAVISHAFDLQHPLARQWAHLGGSVGAFLDVTGAAHVASLTLSVSAARAIDGEVPFTELVTLSGNGPMRGFRTNRLLGPTGASLSFDWSWPIWAYLDGVAHVAVGNVFDERFGGFALDQLRMSFGVALAAVHSLDHRFDLTIAWGTDTFARGAEIVSFRLTVGATTEF